MKKVEGQEVDFAMSRRKNLTWGFTSYDRNFDINIGRAALKHTSDVTMGGLHLGEILSLTLGQSSAEQLTSCWHSPTQ
jgi:hypothetical protein